MPLARYKDLCIDVSEATVSAPFWGALLGLDVEYEDGGDAVLSGATPEQTVWINQVPEPRSVKQRVHLDVHAASVEEVESLGARRLSGEGEFGWTVMADREDGEFCVFVRAEPPAYRFYELGVDCVEPTAIARWWGEVLGAKAEDDESGFSYLENVPGMPGAGMTFVPVPEPKTVKNRIHWDVTADSVQALLDTGATLLRERDDEIRWNVMADPEGNEFCAFVP